ncbi:MAG: ankyrin repeat domain-containing protein [Syntrophorhabdaceae bacterium]|nr:ankyrin repeat domain-containing protein [Syntrophorhabdaceae bacterium]
MPMRKEDFTTVNANKPLYGSIRSLKRALEAGADVNARNESGWTMLHHAAAAGDVKMIKFLLESGAGVNARNHLGQTALHVIFDSFVKTRKHTDAVERACLEIACLLIDHGADVNAIDHKYHEPIGYLISNASGKVCRAILQDARVKKDIRMNIRKTLNAFLWTNMKLGVISEIQRVFAAGADPDTRNHLGQTPLHWAAMKGRVDIARILLDAHAETNAQFPANGFTPLHYACMKGFREVAALCIDHGADPDARDNNSETPFHHACRWNFPNLARLLIENGAKLTARTSNGHTGLDLLLASEQKNSTDEIVALYREYCPELVFSAFCTMDVKP